MGRESSASHCWRFMGLWRNPASSSLPSVMVVVSGHVVPGHVVPAHMLSGGILALGFHAKLLAGDSVLCWQEPGAKGQITDLLQFASLASRCFLVTLEWSTELETMLFLLLLKPRDLYLLLGLGNISISPFEPANADSHPFSPSHQEYSLPWA